MDLNGDALTTNVTILSDYNDWGNLSLPFNRSYNINSGISQTPSAKAIVFNPITDDRQPASEEVAPSPFFMDQLRRAQ
jgi:hypothetical protein